MKHPIHEAINKKHGVHVKITVEPIKEDDLNAKEMAQSDMAEGMPEEEASESPEEALKEKRMGMDEHLTAGLRQSDEDQLMSKNPKGLHARVVKAAIMKKKGK